MAQEDPETAGKGVPLRTHHRLVTLAGALTIVGIGVGYAVEGHPIALAWAAGLVAVLGVPEIGALVWSVSRSTTGHHKTLINPWYYVLVITGGLVSIALYPIGIHEHVRDKFGIALKNEPVFGVLLTGIGAFLIVSGIRHWRHDYVRTREDSARDSTPD